MVPRRCPEDALWSLVGAEDAVQRVRTPCGINVGNRRVFRGLVGEVCVVVGCLEPTREHANHDIFWKIVSNTIENSTLHSNGLARQRGSGLGSGTRRDTARTAHDSLQMGW